MATEQPKFYSSDIWLLMSLYHAQGLAVELSDVLWVGDAINRAFFSYDELDGGLHRLIEAGWAVREENRYRLSQTGQSLAESALQNTGGRFQAWMEIAKKLGTNVLYLIGHSQKHRSIGGR